jgi:pimeloyl-ACP methyl ester carboxylesterase
VASSPTEPRTGRWTAPDGTPIAWHELGDGMPLVLVHGLFSSAYVNWIKYGHAALLAGAGFRVIMPDLRAHGASGAPHGAAHYPADILRDDLLGLVDHLALGGDYHLGGYSLGGRTVIRALLAGARPRRAIVSGMGLAGLLDTARRAGFFREVLKGFGTHPRGSPAFMAAAFLKTTGGDPLALLPLLDSFVDTGMDELGSIALPVLVVAGVDDHDNGSAEALARILPRGSFRAIPGNHMSAVAQPALAASILDHLRG